MLKYAQKNNNDVAITFWSEENKKENNLVSSQKSSICSSKFSQKKSVKNGDRVAKTSA